MLREALQTCADPCAYAAVTLLLRLLLYCQQSHLLDDRAQPLAALRGPKLLAAVGRAAIDRSALLLAAETSLESHATTSYSGRLASDMRPTRIAWSRLSSCVTLLPAMHLQPVPLDSWFPARTACPRLLHYCRVLALTACDSMEGVVRHIPVQQCRDTSGANSYLPLPVAYPPGVS